MKAYLAVVTIILAVMVTLAVGHERGLIVAGKFKESDEDDPENEPVTIPEPKPRRRGRKAV